MFENISESEQKFLSQKQERSQSQKNVTPLISDLDSRKLWVVGRSISLTY